MKHRSTGLDSCSPSGCHQQRVPGVTGPRRLAEQVLEDPTRDPSRRLPLDVETLGYVVCVDDGLDSAHRAEVRRFRHSIGMPTQNPWRRRSPRDAEEPAGGPNNLGHAFGIGDSVEDDVKGDVPTLPGSHQLARVPDEVARQMWDGPAAVPVQPSCIRRPVRARTSQQDADAFDNRSVQNLRPRLGSGIGVCRLLRHSAQGSSTCNSLQVPGRLGWRTAPARELERPSRRDVRPCSRPLRRVEH